MKSKRNKATTYRLQSCLVSLQNGSFFPLYVADAHQDFYMRIVMRISAYAHHPHEPHGSASACPSLVCIHILFWFYIYIFFIFAISKHVFDYKGHICNDIFWAN